jgi:transposase InsO family protein
LTEFRPLTDDELLARLKSAEDSFVERKSKQSRNEVVRHAVAFANAVRAPREGVVFFGVNPEGAVIGLENIEKVQQDIRTWLDVISDNQNSRLTTIRIPGFRAAWDWSKLLTSKESGLISNRQVRKLMKLLNQETLSLAAAKAGMDEKTARKYREAGKLPSEMASERNWRTRVDPYAEMWEELRGKLEVNPGLQAKTLFEDLQRRHPGEFHEGQLRTLQRRVKTWRALEGRAKEVFFEQRYEPGVLCQSDFTYMNALGVRVDGQAFDHLVYHFVLPYSNWEWGTVCFTESFESLSAGLQKALWKLGGVPTAHRTDRLSAAVHQEIHPEVFTQRYQALVAHYGMEGRRIQANKPHENGDVEQRHHRLKQAMDQALMLRGSREFERRKEYEDFLGRLFEQAERRPTSSPAGGAEGSETITRGTVGILQASESAGEGGKHDPCRRQSLLGGQPAS